MHVSSQLSKVIQGFINRVIKAFLFLEMRWNCRRDRRETVGEIDAKL